MTSRRRFPLALLVLMLWAGAAPPAHAHKNDQGAPPVIDRIEPAVPGLDVSVVFSANYQFLVHNPTGQDLAVMAQTGEPFLRIGPQGTFANFASRAWFESNLPEGTGRVPDSARSGAKVVPDWRLVRREPAFGWFDHRLHPVERYVDAKTRRSKKTVRLGDWSVPIRFGATAGEIAGHFEFQPTLGSYRSALASPERPADGVSVQLAASSTPGGVPALFVENQGTVPVIVLGEGGEPFVRLGPGASVNEHSPTWLAIEQARGRSPAGSAEPFAASEPRWKEVQSSPKWGWPELRAAPPVGNPTREVTGAGHPTTVKRWSVPVRIGEQSTEISGITEFVPIGVRADEDENGSPSLFFLSLGLFLTSMWFFLRSRRRAKGVPGSASRLG